MSTGADPNEPNFYRLQGADGSMVIYSTSSLTGEPKLTYGGPQGQHLFTGDEEIETAVTALGTEVTVTLSAIPDGGTMTLTLLLPPVALEGAGFVPLATWGIVTTKVTSIAGPPPGQQFSYQTVPLAGEARLLEF